MHSDATATIGTAWRRGPGKVRHLDVRRLWTQSVVRTLGLKIEKVPGHDNRADLGTKRHTAKEFLRLRDLAQIKPETVVSAQTAPSVSQISLASSVPDFSSIKEQLSSILRALSGLSPDDEI